VNGGGTPQGAGGRRERPGSIPLTLEEISGDEGTIAKTGGEKKTLSPWALALKKKKKKKIRTQRKPQGRWGTRPHKVGWYTWLRKN